MNKTQLFDEPLMFVSLSSGSSGNSYYIGTQSFGVLIDAGISSRRIRKYLNDLKINLKNVKAVLITHEHSDHVKGLTMLSNRHFIPVYATENTQKALKRGRFTHDVNPASYKDLNYFTPIIINNMIIEPFPVSHDSADSVGFYIKYHDKSITLATDLGYICNNVEKYLKKSKFIVLESNYDEYMLENGSYPICLKQRIGSNKGHLNNKDSANFLAKIYNNDISHILLCHLSNENNTPAIAIETLTNTFKEKQVLLNKKTVIADVPRSVRSDVFIV